MESKKVKFLDFITLHFIYLIELSDPNMKNKSVKNFRNSFTIGALRKPLLLLKEPYFFDFFIRIRNLNTCSTRAQRQKKSQPRNWFGE